MKHISETSDNFNAFDVAYVARWLQDRVGGYVIIEKGPKHYKSDMITQSLVDILWKVADKLEENGGK